MGRSSVSKSEIDKSEAEESRSDKGFANFTAAITYRKCPAAKMRNKSIQPKPDLTPIPERLSERNLIEGL